MSSSPGHSLRIACTVVAVAVLAGPTAADQIRFDRPSEWRQWSLPLGAVELDGDVVRTHLSKGLGFSKEDRDINIRRIGWVCHILSRNGVVAIAAAISPYRAIRDENRKMIEHFVEVYCKCDLAVLEERDVKGLYKKARSGEIAHFTGISDPYEAPENAEVVIESDKETPEESAAKILQKLEELKYIPRAGA